MMDYFRKTLSATMGLFTHPPQFFGSNRRGSDRFRQSQLKVSQPSPAAGFRTVPVRRTGTLDLEHQRQLNDFA
jgi:hypothetical protein